MFVNADSADRKVDTANYYKETNQVVQYFILSIFFTFYVLQCFRIRLRSGFRCSSATRT